VFITALPPPSTRLPGAPPPPVLPPHLYAASRESILHPHVPTSQDESSSAKVKRDPGREPPHGKYKLKPSSPVRQTKDIPAPPSYQTQEGRHEQMPHKYSDRTLHGPASDGLKENSGEERYKPNSREDSRPKIISETIPASWDRPRDIAPPPARKLTLPASLPPKPVAALGDLNLQSSASLRAGNSSRGRRTQRQSPDEGNSHGTTWGSAPRGDGGKDNDRERNRWGPTPEYRGPSLLARISSDEPPGKDLMETERAGSDIQRKRARTRKYQGHGS
jgi:hypothetical protein